MRLAALLAIVAVLSGCGGDDRNEEVLVSAAASLSDAFDAIALAFEDANPDVDVILNIAGSSALREQILDGASVDVFASADASNLDEVVIAGLTVGEPRALASNRLQIAVPAGNPAGIQGLDDFGDEDLLIGLCAVGVPCGDFAREALEKAGVDPAPDSNEPDVRSLLTKIEEGELDAGITYSSDVSASNAVEGIDIPEEHNVIAGYQIALLSDARDPDLGAAFIEFVLSPEGQEIMDEFGFAAP